MQQSNKPLIIKVGTSSITNADGLIDTEQMKNIVEQIVRLHEEGHRIILITSGAVGTGKTLTALHDTSDDIAQRQVFAAVGQAALIGEYRKFFSVHNVVPAQILLTKEDFRDDLHRANIERCLKALLHEKIIPIINENDTTAIEELMFTDNDELTMLIAILLEASRVVMLTSVDGVLVDGVIVPSIDKTSIKNVIKSLDGTLSRVGRGGMKSKLHYAEILMGHGIPVVIAHARKPHIIEDVICKKAIGTYIT